MDNYSNYRAFGEYDGNKVTEGENEEMETPQEIKFKTHRLISYVIEHGELNIMQLFALKMISDLVNKL